MGYGKISLISSQITILVKIIFILFVVITVYILVYYVNTGPLVCVHGTYHVFNCN